MIGVSSFKCSIDEMRGKINSLRGVSHVDMSINRSLVAFQSPRDQNVIRMSEVEVMDGQNSKKVLLL